MQSQIDAPAGHQRAVTDDELRGAERPRAWRRRRRVALWPAHLDATAGDHQPVHRKAAAVAHRHRQRVRHVGLPVEQAHHRPGAVCRAQFQGAVVADVELQRLDKHPALGEFDHGVPGHVLTPRGDRVGDAVVEPVAAADAIGLGLARLQDRLSRMVGIGHPHHPRRRVRQHAPVLAAADIGAEAVLVGNPHALAGDLRRRKGDAARAPGRPRCGGPAARNASRSNPPGRCWRAGRAGRASIPAQSSAQIERLRPGP